LSQIITKKFNELPIRIILINSKEYFVAKDIAELLEYKNTRKAVLAHCKKATTLKEILKSISSLPLEREKLKENLTGFDIQTKFILEPDVWRLIIKSEMPEAEKIEEWIFEEVLPSIRKTGKYELENSQPNQPVQTQTSHNFDLDSYISENEKLIKLIKLITSENVITLHYLDKLTQTLNLKSPLELLQIDLNSHYFIPTELGKFLNKSAVEINKILEAKKYQIKVNGIWQLTNSGKKYAIQLDNKFSTIKWKLESLV
jgi:prophage antirepressor-like protein